MIFKYINNKMSTGQFPQAAKTESRTGTSRSPLSCVRVDDIWPRPTAFRAVRRGRDAVEAEIYELTDAIDEQIKMRDILIEELMSSSRVSADETRRNLESYSEAKGAGSWVVSSGMISSEELEIRAECKTIIARNIWETWSSKILTLYNAIDGANETSSLAIAAVGKDVLALLKHIGRAPYDKISPMLAELFKPYNESMADENLALAYEIIDAKYWLQIDAPIPIRPAVERFLKLLTEAKFASEMRDWELRLKSIDEISVIAEANEKPTQIIAKVVEYVEQIKARIIDVFTDPDFAKQSAGRTYMFYVDWMNRDMTRAVVEQFPINFYNLLELISTRDNYARQFVRAIDGMDRFWYDGRVERVHIPIFDIISFATNTTAKLASKSAPVS